MVELFRLEVENQSIVFTENLLALEQNHTDGSRLGALMRAAHSLKGAARMMEHDSAVSVAHELEDVFVAAQEGSLLLLPEHVDVLLRAGADKVSVNTAAWVSLTASASPPSCRSYRCRVRVSPATSSRSTSAWSAGSSRPLR